MCSQYCSFQAIASSQNIVELIRQHDGSRLGRTRSWVGGVIRSGAAAVVAALCLFGNADSALGFQSHPAPEGLYVHQLAHAFFAVAMGMLAYWLKKNGLSARKGWRLIQISCLLFILWNVATFSGHVVEELLPADLFAGDPDWTQRIVIQGNPMVQLYYVLKMDHIICVPAMLCLLLGMRGLYKQALQERKPSDD